MPLVSKGIQDVLTKYINISRMKKRTTPNFSHVLFNIEMFGLLQCIKGLQYLEKPNIYIYMFINLCHS